MAMPGKTAARVSHSDSGTTPESDEDVAQMNASFPFKKSRSFISSPPSAGDRRKKRIGSCSKPFIPVGAS
ncbi:hypothetical protein D3C75_361840 [compost metagenome]